jgi:hypothetical protein
MLRGWNTQEYPEWHWNTNQRQKQHRSTTNKVERPTASPRFSFHGRGHRCPTPVYVHDDDDDDDDDDFNCILVFM